MNKLIFVFCNKYILAQEKGAQRAIIEIYLKLRRLIEDNLL